VSTALSVYYAFAASSTISTANKLYTGTGGSPTTAQNLTSVNASTGYGEIPAQGSAAAWAASGSIGTPTGKGFFLDATTLDGQDLIAGNYSAIIRFNTQATGNVTADIYVRVYRYRPGTTTYTQIVSMVLTGQTITNTITSFSLPSTSTGSNTSFATGDKLYVDVWLDITATTSSSGQQIKHNRQSTDTTTFVGDTQAVVVTPGYQLTVTGTTVLKDLSIRVLIAAQSLKNLSLRALISAQSQKNLTLRAIIAAQSQKNLTLRARVSAVSLKDLSVRARVSATNQRNLAFRVIVGNISQKNLTLRARVSAQSPKDLSTRTRVSAQSQRNLAFRAIVGILIQKNLSLRARVSAQGQRDLTLRVIITALVLPSPYAPQTPSFYMGTGAYLPLGRPVLPYVINGITLDLPTICTAPMGSNSVLVPTGSVFTLLFTNPSAQTQSMLTNYPTATMTFTLYGGEQVTGLVALSTTTGSPIWQVFCTTLAPIQVQRWRVQSQFS
jgi:hypothetical protein